MHALNRVETQRDRAWRRRRLTLALASALLAATIRVASADELKPFTATYAGVWNGHTVGVSVVELQKSADDTWTYRSHIEPRGLYVVVPMRPKMVSVLRVTKAGVQPLSYKAAGWRTTDVKYDWQQGRVTGVYEGTPIDLPLKPGVQDELSAQVALMVELLRGHTPDRFLLLDKNEVKEYLYAKESEEMIATPLGNIETMVYRSQRPGSIRANRYWCAADSGYIPLRVEQKVGDEVQWGMRIENLKR